MSPRPLTFADANAPFEGARFVIVGVPYDHTASFRAGAKFAANAMREVSWNFESYMIDHDLDISEIDVHDLGNTDEAGRPEDMMDALKETVSDILKNRSFPITLGGEHSLTPAIISAIKEKMDVGVIVLDAHLDFRNEYLNIKNSHACASRRMSEIVGPENIVPIGVRSVSREEIDDIEANFKGKFRYIDAFEVRKTGMEWAVKKAMRLIKKRNIYLSLDIDSIDPSFAPGTGTPEPFGLSVWDVKECIRLLADRLVGFDIVEVAPMYDNGNTAAVGARLVREVIAAVHLARKASGTRAVRK